MLIFVSQDIPLLHTPVEVAGGKIGTQEVPSYGGKGYLKELVDVDGEVVEGGAIRTSTSDVSMFKQYKKYAHPIRQMEMGQMGGEMMMGQRRRYSQYRSGIFDGMALSDEFLDEYYSNVSILKVVQNQMASNMNGATRQHVKTSKSCIVLSGVNEFEYVNMFAEIQLCGTAIPAEGWFAGL